MTYLKLKDGGTTPVRRRRMAGPSRERKREKEERFLTMRREKEREYIKREVVKE